MIKDTRRDFDSPSTMYMKSDSDLLFNNRNKFKDTVSRKCHGCELLSLLRLINLNSACSRAVEQPTKLEIKTFLMLEVLNIATSLYEFKKRICFYYFSVSTVQASA